MDLHDFWQENKRWLLGIAIGLVVYWVASSIISNQFDTRSVTKKTSAVRRTLQREEGFYSREQLSKAREINAELRAARARLEEALVFEPGDDYLLDGKGDAHLHFDQVSRRVQRSLMNRADALGVGVGPKSLDWPAPEGLEKIARTLIGVCLLETAVNHLLDAHEAVRGSSLSATGLDSIDFFRVQASRKDPRRRSTRRGRREAPSAAESITEEQVRFKFSCDEATVYRFLEACRREHPRITLDSSFKITPSRNPGEPLVVTGTLSAIRIQDNS